MIERSDPPAISDWSGSDTVVVAPWANSAAKRAFDLVVALPLAVLTLPLLALLLAGSAVVFRANPLFTQDRLGRGGSMFRFLKIRSLAPSVPSSIDKYALAQQPLSRWGGFIRSTHLDELPQLWLVVSGAMSLVGPRPELPEIAAGFDPEFVHRRTLVRPGVTGLWQTSQAVVGLIGEAPEFDDLYLARASARLDLRVVIQTIRQPFGGELLTFAESEQLAA